MRIVVWLLLALVALAMLLAALGVLAVVGMRQSQAEIFRAEQSLTQLENARAVEAAFNRYLLGEIRRRLEQHADRGESPAAGELRGALLTYRRTIGEEIAAGDSDAERAEERHEMVRASALAELFETIETESMLDRSIPAARGASEDARWFLGRIAAGREEIFRSVVFEILGDERAEANDAFARLDALRARMLRAGSALAAAFLVAMAGIGYLFYRGLMRPIQQLTTAAEGLPGAALAARVPEALPGEFSLLARRFNAMAERIGTEQQRLQAEVAARTAELQAANAELTRIDRSRREFFANLSHELRTPVTVLIGEAQVALRNPGAEREALARIAANGGFLRRRLEDFLRLARSEDGELRLDFAPMDLTAAVAEAVDAVRAYAAANGIAVDFAPGPEIRLDGNHEALRQATLALIDNAIKFSPEGATVTVRTTDRGFTVADTGPGFGTTDPAQLFARYARGGRGRGGSGSGLGLAIVKWIADEHGARVRAENRPEGGAMIGLEFSR